MHSLPPTLSDGRCEVSVDRLLFCDRKTSNGIESMDMFQRRLDRRRRNFRIILEAYERLGRVVLTLRGETSRERYQLHNHEHIRGCDKLTQKTIF